MEQKYKKNFLSSNDEFNDDMEATEDNLKGLAYTGISFIATVIVVFAGIFLLVW